MTMITAENRDGLVKAKQLRRNGIVPCVIYGGSLPETLLIQLDQNNTNKLLRSKREGSKTEIKFNDKILPVQIKDIEKNFIKGQIIHISFEALEEDVKVNSKAQIILKNADKIQGILEHVLFEIPYSCLPEDMVDTVTIDLEGVATGTILTVGDLPEFKNNAIELQVDPESMILKINDKKRLGTQTEE